jgi:HD-like signal output (HDOD) protein
MKPRHTLTTEEVEALHTRLARRLEEVGIETQPKVALRMLQLAQRADVELSDYEQTIRTDSALSGRLLRLANSAFYAQRHPVTRLQRALVLMGIQRVKAISLGFYMSRAASAQGAREISRQVWGQSVYRACLCSALAQVRCPQLAPEAYLIGLMLDSGVPIMARLVGPAFEEIYHSGMSPTKMNAAELASLEFTHVDVVTAMVHRWGLPEILAHPIAMHHVPPPLGRTKDPVATLRQVSYYAGAVSLRGEGEPAQEVPLASVASRVLQVVPAELEKVVRLASADYAATSQMFSDLAEEIDDVDELADSVQRQLVGVMDQQIEHDLRAESSTAPRRFLVAGQEIEVVRGEDGTASAFINDETGRHLLSCTVRPGAETPASLRLVLGLDEASDEELGELALYLRFLAA